MGGNLEHQIEEGHMYHVSITKATCDRIQKYVYLCVCVSIKRTGEEAIHLIATIGSASSTMDRSYGCMKWTGDAIPKHVGPIVIVSASSEDTNMAKNRELFPALTDC